jgi:hypothetical protein
MTELGKTYRDTVTGFVGVCVSKSIWMTGCSTSGLTPPVDKDGKVLDTQWFDDGRLYELNTIAQIKIAGVDAVAAPKTIGGPCESVPHPNR